MKHFRRRPLLRIHREGYAILFLVLLFLLVINSLVYFKVPQDYAFWISNVCSVLAFCFFLYFFRNPAREYIMDDPNLVISAADGRVCAIEPVEVEEYFGGKKMLQVSVFMSVFSVHANWYPIDGIVKFATHHKGRHVAAFLPKSSTENEHSTVVIEHENKTEIMVRQIAGALARRVVCYATKGHKCCVNEHMGFIKFGSRVDMFLPMDSQILVKVGDSTTANSTVLARLPEVEENNA